MQVVADSAVQARFSNGFARVVDMVCPHCQKEAPFEARVWHEHGRRVGAAETSCPRCGGEVLFLLVMETIGPQREGVLYAWPPASTRVPMPGVEQLEALSASLGRTYDSALRLFNRGEWGSAALSLRHLLEGVVARLAGEGARELPFGRQLALLPERVDLARPLGDVADLLALDGPLGRAFEDETAIDGATAAQLLDVVELLIAYLVALPGAMGEVHGRIANAPVPLRRPPAPAPGAAATGGDALH